VTARVEALLEKSSTPGFGVYVVEGLGERPLVAREVGGCVLSLAVLEVGRLHEYPGPVRSRSGAMGVHIVHTHRDRVRHLTFSRRATVMAHVADDDRAASEGELRAVVLTDLQSLDESERGAQPGDGFAHVWVDEYGNDDGRRDRPVSLHDPSG
jgi:hypothetical protein